LFRFFFFFCIFLQQQRRHCIGLTLAEPADGADANPVLDGGALRALHQAEHAAGSRHVRRRTCPRAAEVYIFYM
jgi:hypothetical protein